MSVTVELSELDADLWEAFKRGGAWVAHSEYMKLKADNAKLRELVRDMYKAFMHGNCYRWCEFKEPCQWYDRMRELGVEVTS